MIKKIISLVACGCLFVGCSLNERDFALVEEGVVTEVNLGFGVSNSPVYTRAAQSSEDEFYVENIYILVFDNNSNYQRVPTTDDSGDNLAFFTSGNITVTQGSSDKPTEGSVSFNVPVTNSATVVALANIGIEDTRYAVTKDELDAVNSLDDLKDLVVGVTRTVSRGDRFMMSGYGENSKGSRIITISSNASGEKLDCTVKLKRLDAKVEVNITSEVPQGKNWTALSFQPKTWQVVNVPAQSRLLPYEKAGIEGPWVDQDENTKSQWDALTGPDGAVPVYYPTQEYGFEVEDTYEYDNTMYYKGGSFVFYMPENRKLYKASAPAYQDRDEQEGGVPTYANDNSTYMVLTGYLSYIDNDNDAQVINAEVRYIIYLGFASGNINDYDTEQNGYYKYTLTVKGITDIEAEVDDGNERRPGYEGDVVKSKQIFNVDAHYETRLLEIPVDSDFQNMTWGVRTPFSSGVYDGSVDYTGIKDYQWIKFAINRHFGTSHGVFVKFPGAQNYHPELTVQQLDALVEDGDGTNQPLFDIDQLIKYLKFKQNSLDDLKATGASDHICITAFVDEYLYLSNPEKEEDDDLLFWKQCVDTDDRQLHIMTEGSRVSQDENSSITEALYTFSQRSIRTIYDRTSPDVSTAWGLETVIEPATIEQYNDALRNIENSNRLPVGRDQMRAALSNRSDNRNGRQNMVYIMAGKNWAIVNTDYNVLSSGYESAAYACMLRNRDENGDGEITNSEIRWYLAAIDQLTDIYIGEWALNNASRLYPDYRPGGNAQYWHYTSSSWNSDDDAPWVLWAEEGASRGTYSGNPGSIQTNGEYYSYRCVRNLGINVESTAQIPQDFVKKEGSGLGPYTINLSGMNPKSLRDAPERGNLSYHDEKSDVNRPYEGFEILPDTYPTPQHRGSSYNEKMFYNAMRWDEYNSLSNSINPCPQGYRLPNQRELLIMTTRLDADAWETFNYKTKSQKAVYVSRTAFSLNGQYDYEHRNGFIWSAQNEVFMLQNWDEPWPWQDVEDGYTDSERGYVRCICDTDPGTN